MTSSATEEARGDAGKEARGGERRGPGGAVKVAAGILSSRLFGFVRDATLAFYFGAGGHADVFRTALRGPNLLQNLLGEQALSASFIPIYTRMVHEGREREAGRFAGAIFGLLLAVAATVSLLGVIFARPIVGLLAPGYLADAARVAAAEVSVDRFELAVRAVRIVFPMTGLLVLSAWCLGVLNSHRRFFLPYFAPVLWNAAIVAALVWAGRGLATGEAAAAGGIGWRDDLLIAACFGGLIGGLLQFLVQVPSVRRLLRHFRLSLSLRVEGVRAALKSLAPVIAARGVVQISAYLDLVLASLLAAGAVGGLGWAQTLYLLPIGLFGMSVAAAELPELARRSDPTERREIERRVPRSLAQMAYLTVPTTIGYMFFGFLVVGGVYRRGSFGMADNWLVYLALCGYSLGLLASTSSRLLTNVFYSLLETRIPALVASARVVLSTLLGVTLMLRLDRIPVATIAGADASGSKALRLGGVGLALAAGISAWVELGLLRRALRRPLPGLRLPLAPLARFVVLSAVAALPAAVLWRALPAGLPPLFAMLAVVGLYAGAYLLSSWLLGIEEARLWWSGLTRRTSKGERR
jgi:putative peptidoglycan lipid II flippase